MSYRMRPRGDDDNEALIGLSLRAWAPVFKSIKETLGRDVFQRLHPDWQASQRHAVEAACTSETIGVWVWDQDGTIVGFVAVDLPVDSVMGEIHMVAVDPKFQAQGIGTAMTSFAIERIRDAGRTVAMVETGADPGHAAARRTYEKTEFKLVPVARYFRAL